MLDEENKDIMRRAFAAWFRAGGEDQPMAEGSNLEAHEGRKYAVLRNACGVLAVYRVTIGGQLKRLKRWPKGIEAIHHVIPREAR